jgi:hypothetical protein
MANEIGSFPTIRNVLNSGDNILSMTAGEALKAGQCVGFAATGVANTVVVMDNTSDEYFVGVAVYDAASGAKVAVATVGCVCTVANENSVSTIEAGKFVSPKTLGGVIEHTYGGTEGTYTIVGICLDGIAANSIGRVLIIPSVSDEEVAA